MSRNYLLNPDFSVAQRGTSFTSTSSPANSDDTFLLDRWILLHLLCGAGLVMLLTCLPTTERYHSLRSLGAMVGGAQKLYRGADGTGAGDGGCAHVMLLRIGGPGAPIPAGRRASSLPRT